MPTLLPDPEQPVWSSPPDLSPLPPDAEVHVWRAPLPATLHDALRAAVSDAELRYAERMTSDTARRQFTAAQAALRLMLSRYIAEPPELIRFVRGEHGKPFLDSDYQSAIQFNLTHSHDLAIAAVTTGRQIGVDVEKVRERPAAPRLAARFFAERERAALEAVSDSDMERVFFRLWTRKESHIKATGTGLSVNLKAIDTLAGEPPWWYHEFAADAEYVASLAGTGQPPHVRYFDLHLPS